jgi:DHA2 family multidrug resistance protein-like MFS transporter
VVAVVLSWATLPRSGRKHAKFDVVAGVLTVITFAALIYGLGSAAQEAPLRYTITALVVFVVACLLLVRYERGSVAPMLPLDLFRFPLFTLSALTAFCAFATQGLAFVALPFFLEHTLGMAADHTGFVMSPWSVVVAMVAPIAGRLSDKVAPGLLGSAGLAMLAVGMALLAPTIIWLNVVAIVACMALCGAGFGLFQSPNLKALMSSAPRARSAGASGVVATARLIGQASGAALVALCFGIAGANGPVVALALGCGFAAVGSVASASRLLVART